MFRCEPHEQPLQMMSEHFRKPSVNNHRSAIARSNYSPEKHVLSIEREGLLERVAQRLRTPLARFRCECVTAVI